MKPVNSTVRKRNMLLSALAFIVTAGLFFLLFNSSKQLGGVNLSSAPSVRESTAAPDDYNDQLLRYDEQLHARLNDLKQLDSQFTELLISTAPNKNYDSLNMVILQQEENFRKAIENVQQQETVFNKNKNAVDLFSKMISSFGSILDSRKSAGSLRNIAVISQGNFTPDEKAMFKLQEELMAKTNRITSLGSSLNTLEKKLAGMPVNNKNEKFADSIKFIASINVLENKIAALNTNMNNLKQENDRLQKLDDENSKRSGSNEAVLKEKANGLQQRIESLNAELQLARVDCNLNRVDATQIISSAKQRKQLLNEASSILTDLSVSGNTDTKRKVQEKIMRLNQVAANSRD